MEDRAAILHRFARGFVEAPVEPAALQREIVLPWPSTGGTSELRVFAITTRGNSAHEAIERARCLNDAIEAEFQALALADAVVFFAGAPRWFFGKNKHFVKLLRADLVAAGREPGEVPVVFLIDHRFGPDMQEATRAELLDVLTWPRAAHVETFSNDDDSAELAIRGAVGLHEQMTAERCG